MSTVVNVGNSSLEEIAEVLKSANSIAICGHTTPDGDCIGSQMAAYHALRALGKSVKCLLARNEALDKSLSFLPGCQDMIAAKNYTETPDVFLALDVPNVGRMGVAGAEVFERAPVTITIDHHRSEEPMSNYNFVSPTTASASMLVWDLIGCLGVEKTKDIAQCCYHGLVTDTGSFRHQNTSVDCFEYAMEMLNAGADIQATSEAFFMSRRYESIALEQEVLSRLRRGSKKNYAITYITREDFKKFKCKKIDAEPIVEVMRSIDGVRVACILREESNRSIRGSFRASDDTDVSRLANFFGGGGHKGAAGFGLFASLSDDSSQKQVSPLEAFDIVTDLLEECLCDKKDAKLHHEYIASVDNGE